MTKTAGPATETCLNALVTPRAAKVEDGAPKGPPSTLMVADPLICFAKIEQSFAEGVVLAGFKCSFGVIEIR